MPRKPSIYKTIRVTRAGGLTTITLDRQPKLNAIDAAMHRELQAACAALRDDSTTRVVILTGAGRAFSSGNDLRPAPRKPARDDAERRLLVSDGARTSEALESLDQVTIAAVNGLAVGGAVVLAACCDIRLAARSAWFSIPEVDLALPLTWNALPRLMRELGPARTKELVMTCDRFSAEDAERWGFVNHVYDDADLMPQARALAKKLLAKDHIALASTKTTTNALARLMVPNDATHADRELLLLASLAAQARARASRK